MSCHAVAFACGFSVFFFPFLFFSFLFFFLAACSFVLLFDGCHFLAACGLPRGFMSLCHAKFEGKQPVVNCFLVEVKKGGGGAGKKATTPKAKGSKTKLRKHVTLIVLWPMRQPCRSYVRVCVCVQEGRRVWEALAENT